VNNLHNLRDFFLEWCRWSFKLVKTAPYHLELGWEKKGSVMADEQEYDLFGPRADALIESLRAAEYSLPDSIGDLIDNSLPAHAQVKANFAEKDAFSIV
jgi:hypothetical protein